MRVLTLRLFRFRNHRETELAFCGGANVFLGGNGEGKTNVVEGVAYLCLTKSFYAANDRTVVQVGEEGFEVGGTVESDRGTSSAVSIRFGRESSEKVFSINGKSVESLASVIGKFPVVVISPEHQGITSGSPADRRRFLDLAVAQASPPYMEDLLEYRRALRQRNKVLLEARLSGRRGAGVLEAWDEPLVARGARLTVKRREFLVEFGPRLQDTYRRIGGEEEVPAAEYISSIGRGEGDVVAVQEAFLEALAAVRDEEYRLGSSQVGPHRDELRFTVNSLDLRGYASQGQHKTFLTALKVAEYQYLREHCGESPVLILDDVFSELDQSRIERLLDLVEPLGQMFMTTTDRRVFPEKFLKDRENRTFCVEKGRVR